MTVKRKSGKIVFPPQRRFFPLNSCSSPPSSNLARPSYSPLPSSKTKEYLQYFTFLMNLLDIPQPSPPMPMSENHQSGCCTYTQAVRVPRSPSRLSNAGESAVSEVERVRTGTGGQGGGVAVKKNHQIFNL